MDIARVTFLLLSIVCLVKADAPPDAKCFLTPTEGTGIESLMRWYYDSHKGKCEVLIYTGTGGNGNRFRTLKECHHTCVCSRPKDPGPCMAMKERYYFNKATGYCEMFHYGGCKGNGNVFATMSECMQTCVCNRDVQTGHCKADIKAYHFNDNTKKCEQFSYGGCGGNANKFDSYRECTQSCVCGMKPETGPCRASMHMNYYHQESGTCKTFTYGGCQGNGNKFTTKKECLDACFLE